MLGEHQKRVSGIESALIQDDVEKKKCLPF